MDGSGRHDPGCVHWKPNFSQVRDVAYAPVDHRPRVSARGHSGTHQSTHPGDVGAIFDRHDVNRVGRAFIDGGQHSTQCRGIAVAFIRLQLHRARKSGEFRREDRLHAVAHVHAFSHELFDRVRHRGDFHSAVTRDQRTLITGGRGGRRLCSQEPGSERNQAHKNDPPQTSNVRAAFPPATIVVHYLLLVVYMCAGL